jgi:phenylpropionate dioxygenase-like ring-hydroxylating dioxygenase large terminal subunit
LRRYWIPVAPLAQLLENPVRKVRILGEDLVLYRNNKGGLGLIGDRCLHRLVDMQWGIPEDNGLRCPYHGWKYDVNGNCTEVPSEPTLQYLIFPREWRDQGLVLDPTHVGNFLRLFKLENLDHRFTFDSFATSR